MPDIEIPPGIIKTRSGASATGRFVDGDKVRFENGKAEKIRGWAKHFATQLAGVPRTMHSFLGPSGLELLAVGTQLKLYIVETDGTVKDITPLRATASLANPFSTTNTSFIVSVADTAHGALQGDTVIFSGASAVGGITIDGAYTITSVTSANAYTITHSIAATSTAGPGGGGAVSTEYEINIGTTSSAFSVGYGTGPYGSGGYGEPSTASTLVLDARIWSLDHYGDNLMAAYTGGTIYLYDDDVDTRAQPLANAPTDVRFAFITGERYITALCEDMTIRWPDLDDPTDWTPGVTDTGNTRRLGVGNKLIAGAVIGNAASLIWSDEAVYLHQYTGGDFVYDTRVVGRFCGLAGPNAQTIVDGTAYWMSTHGFHMFNGASQPIPMQEDISDWLFSNIAELMRVKATCFYNANFNEIWFLYAATDETEPGNYAAVKIGEWYWAPGTMARVGATLRLGGSALPRPLLASSDGYVYEHERPETVNDDGAAMAWFLETGLWAVPGATNAVDIFGFAPDNERQSGTIRLDVEGRDRPQSTSFDTDTVYLTPTTEMADLRVSGRYFKYRLSQDEIDGDFREGKHVLEIQGGGARR